MVALSAAACLGVTRCRSLGKCPPQRRRAGDITSSSPSPEPCPTPGLVEATVSHSCEKQLSGWAGGLPETERLVSHQGKSHSERSPVRAAIAPEMNPEMKVPVSSDELIKTWGQSCVKSPVERHSLPVQPLQGAPLPSLPSPVRAALHCFPRAALGLPSPSLVSTWHMVAIHPWGPQWERPGPVLDCRLVLSLGRVVGLLPPAPPRAGALCGRLRFTLPLGCHFPFEVGAVTPPLTVNGCSGCTLRAFEAVGRSRGREWLLHPIISLPLPPHSWAAPSQSGSESTGHAVGLGSHGSGAFNSVSTYSI